MKWGLKGGISIDADSGPPRYVLWYCGGICHQPDTFIQIGFGHTVPKLKDFKSSNCSVSAPWVNASIWYVDHRNKYALNR